MDSLESDKKSFLDKWQFRRKLEIKGALREKLSVHNFKGVQLDPKSRVQSKAQGEVQSKTQSKVAEVNITEQKKVKLPILKKEIPISEILKQNNHNKNLIQSSILQILEIKWRHEKSTVFFFGLVMILSLLALSVQLNKSFGLVGFRFADILYVLFLVTVIISSGLKILKKP